MRYHLLHYYDSWSDRVTYAQADRILRHYRVAWPTVKGCVRLCDGIDLLIS